MTVPQYQEAVMARHSHAVEQVADQIKQVIHNAFRPLPVENGDGTEVEHVRTSTPLQDLASLRITDPSTLFEVALQKITGDRIDDRTYIMEKVIELASRLPSDSERSHELTGKFIGQLWASLEHPPISYLGTGFAYRTADGSNNNVMLPRLGAANTPYARSVRPSSIRSGALPDPGLLFDSVMVRTDKPKEHPNKISSILFYLASIIIHDLFHTSHEDPSISKTSSYLDLAPLYGSSEEDQKNLRTFQDGRIKPDCFSEKRLLGFPPGVGCLLIMFNRFHNYVVTQLAIINEGKRFTKPSTPRDDTPRSQAAWDKYDNDLFQTGRLITCGLYINIILVDYVRTIINLNRTDSKWNLDPRAEDSQGLCATTTPRGVGNQVSAEFNLIYRWHSCISERDEKWTKSLYAEMFDGKDPTQISMRELLMKLRDFSSSIPDDPLKRDFAKLKRKKDDTYDDGELAKILSDSIEDPACAFGANQVPPIMRSVEILGIEQARAWNVGSLNDFRKFFGLKPHETFEDINSDPEVSGALRHLYDHVDRVELYPGVVVEEAKETRVPGSGLATTFTISRAILSDAVTLARSDRFYTVDYSARNLTNWGYTEVASDVDMEEGCVFYKLFLRALPQQFRSDSIYAHYPMTVPSMNKSIMTGLGRVDQYNFDRPTFIPPPHAITSYTTAKAILQNQKDFHVTWAEGLEAQIGPPGGRFMLSGDEPSHAQNRCLMDKALHREKWHEQVKDFYESMTLKLLREKSYKIAGCNQVDIIRDVGNIAQAHFSANIFSLPLKTEDNPLGLFTERELYLVLTLMFIRVFFDLDPAKSFRLTQLARENSQKLGKLVEASVKIVASCPNPFGIVDKVYNKHTMLREYGVHMIRKLLESGMSTYEVAWSQIVPTAAAMVANQGQVFGQIVDYYLSDEGKEHLPEIQRWSKLDTAEADEKILHYAMEGIRLAGAFGSFRKVVNPVAVEDNGVKMDLKPGERILISFVTCARDPKVFPEPDKVRLDRDIDSYLHYGAGPHECLGKYISQTAMTAMLKTVGKLENLRRAPGPQGELKRIPRDFGFFIYMQEDWSDFFPFPASMRVQFDGDLPEAK